MVFHDASLTQRNGTLERDALTESVRFSAKVERCDRKRKYYNLNTCMTNLLCELVLLLRKMYLDEWLDERTAVVIVEGNLYSPQTSSMISFAWSIQKNKYGKVEKHIFIEVSDYVLTSTADPEEKHNNIDLASAANEENDNQFVVTHYLFAALLCFIVSMMNPSESLLRNISERH